MNLFYLTIVLLATTLNFGLPFVIALNQTAPNRSVANSIYNYSKTQQIVIKENIAHFQFDNPLLNFEVSIVSEPEAQALFQYLASQKHIPFQYLEDGCRARAHEMAVLLERKNILTGKVFILVDLKVIKEVEKSARIISWPEHVAPFLLVRENEKLKTYVLDPSLFDSAVENTSWIKIQTDHLSAPNFQIFYTPRFYYQSYSFAHITNKFQEYDLESMNLKLKDYLILQNSQKK